MEAKKKASSHNFKKDDLIREVISKTQEIDSWSKDPTTTVPALPGISSIARPKQSAHTPSVKDKYHRRTGSSIKNQLFDSKAKSADSKLKLSTFIRYLGYIRNAVRKDVARHNPDLPVIVADLCKQYPRYTRLIKTLLTDSDKRVNKVKTTIVNKLISMDNIDADELANKINELATNGQLEHPVIKHLRPTTAQLKRLKELTAKNLKERKSNKQTYNFNFISRVVDECLSSDNFNELALGISLATGRRAVEAVYRGEFKATSKHVVLFSGQAKKGKGVEAKPYKIPTLVEATRIVEAVEKMRSTDRYETLSKELEALDDDKRNEVLNTRCARMLNYTAKRILTPDMKVEKSPVQYKNSRVIALQMAILKIMPTPRYKKLDINEFVLRYQGHDHYDEFANYQDIAIVDEPEEVQPEATKEPVDVDTAALEAVDIVINDMGKKPLWKLHNNVKALAERTGVKLTQTLIYKGREINGKLEKAGGSLALIQTYLSIPEVSAAIERYNKGAI